MSVFGIALFWGMIPVEDTFARCRMFRRDWYRMSRISTRPNVVQTPLEIVRVEFEERLFNRRGLVPSDVGYNWEPISEFISPYRELLEFRWTPIFNREPPSSVSEIDVYYSVTEGREWHEPLRCSHELLDETAE
jgi:hypothetical protein